MVLFDVSFKNRIDWYALHGQPRWGQGIDLTLNWGQILNLSITDHRGYLCREPPWRGKHDSITIISVYSLFQSFFFRKVLQEIKILNFSLVTSGTKTVVLRTNTMCKRCWSTERAIERFFSDSSYLSYFSSYCFRKQLLFPKTIRKIPKIWT